MNKNILKKIKQAAHLTDNNHHKQAQKTCLEMLKNKTKHPDIHFILGLCLLHWHQFKEASQQFQQTLQQQASHTGARINLMLCYKNMGQLEKNIELCQPFLNNPQSPMETYHAFLALRDTCNWHEANKLQDHIISSLKQGKILKSLTSNTLIYLNELTDIDPNDLLQIHKQWGEETAKECAAYKIKLPQAKPPGKKIKIGYLSVDFNKHPVGHFALPIIQHHDRERFEIFCYGRLITDDYLTALFRQEADHFIDITSLSPAQAAMRIAKDGIHILIDLSGHTAQSPIEALAFKPAPVQISYLGYPNTTGLDAVDFRITDQHCDSVNGTRYVEQLLHMPDTFLCMLGLPDVEPATQTPAEANGFITFGSFNNIRKINPQVIKAWAGIMQKAIRSKILIKSKGCEQDIIRNHILEEFSRFGIGTNRIIFHTYSKSYEDHAAVFNQVDIALDTFPYHGTHTTCDALAMGLPVITLEGKAHVQRVSASILKCIGFESTIAHSIDEYIDIAADLASRPENLTLLRNCIRTLFTHSSILDPKKITRQLEEQYLKAWEIKMGTPALTENSTLSEQIQTAAFTMNDDITIMLPQDLNHICTYVLTEQGDWYEDELRFLRLITKPGMRILDCSAEYGCYSLSLAKEVGSDGAVLALNHEVNKQNAIEESAIKNSFSQLNTGSANDAPAFLKTGADIVLHAENGIDSNSVCFNISNESSPIMMIKSMNENGMDETLTKRMQQQGFNPYRLIPALNLLVPVPAGFIPTSWHQQLFFCKQDKAKVLANDGFLLLNELESIDLPDDLSYWQQAIEGRAFANALLPLWIEQVQDEQTSDDWEQVRNALSAYAMAHNNDSTPQQRYAYLSASLNLLLNTEGLQSSTARLCTVVRIASELGNYITAIQAAQMVHEGIITLQTFSPNEPFLPISSCYDQDDCQNNIAEWALAQAIAQEELLLHPTSFLNNGAETLKTADILHNKNLTDKTVFNRKALVFKRILANKAKNNKHTKLLPNILLDNKQMCGMMLFDRLSPDMWRMLKAYYDKASTDNCQSLILAVPNNEDRDKIATYLQTMHQAEEGIQPQSVQIIVNNANDDQRPFLHNILQQCEALHVPKESTSKLQKIVTHIAKQLEIEVVWHKEHPKYVPTPLLPIKDKILHAPAFNSSTSQNVLVRDAKLAGITVKWHDDIDYIRKPLPPIKDFQVTITVNTYNRVNLLKRCINSILKQSYDKFTLTINDDASTDGTEAYCTALIKRNPIIHYRRKGVNVGPGAIGADLSWVKTELMMGMTDDDFLLDPTALEKMVDAFRQHPHIGMAFGQCHIGDVYKEIPQNKIPINCTVDCILDPQQMLLDSITGNQIYGAAQLVRIMPFDLKVYGLNHWEKPELGLEGDYLVSMLQCVTMPIAYVHIPTVYYSLWSETISSSQLGGDWGMNIRLRTIAFIDDMYIRHFGQSESEDKRIQSMVKAFKNQYKHLKASMSSEMLIKHEKELDSYLGLIECIQNHKFPTVLKSTSLL